MPMVCVLSICAVNQAVQIVAAPSVVVRAETGRYVRRCVRFLAVPKAASAQWWDDWR